MEILKIAILIITAIVICNGIPTLSKEIAAFITISCCIVVLLYTIGFVVPAVDFIKNMARNINFEGADIVLKAVGIGFVTQFISDMAADNNNKALAGQMIFAGRISILAAAMPVFVEIFKIIEMLTS